MKAKATSRRYIDVYMKKADYIPVINIINLFILNNVFFIQVVNVSPD